MTLSAFSANSQKRHLTDANREFIQYNGGLTKFKLPDKEQNIISDFPQLFICRKGEILMQPDGTGRLYRVNSESYKVKLIRVDSTIYFGSTFGCYLFTYNDSIYSLGGYGYWKYNGLLRVFIEQKGEWELEKLNREIPVARFLGFINPVWLNSAKGELWLTYSSNRKEGIESNLKINPVIDSVFVLNLKTKNWTTKGHLTDSIYNLFNSVETKLIAASPWGQLIYAGFRDKIILINYKENKLMGLSDSKSLNILRLITSYGIQHFSDSSLVIQSGEDWLRGNFFRGDTVILSQNDFFDTNINVFDPSEIGDQENLPLVEPIDGFKLIISGFVIGTFFSGFVVGLMYYLRKINRKRPIHESSDPTMSLGSYFDEREKEIIRLIKFNTSKGQGTSIDEINRILGVSTKSIELQKKHRSEVLISINNKWRGIIHAPSTLIDKKRLQHDKRSYEYFISDSHINSISDL